MDISLIEMTVYDLEQIKLEDFDNFWTYNILKEELSSPNSIYIVAKYNSQIVGFARD